MCMTYADAIALCIPYALVSIIQPSKLINLNFPLGLISTPLQAFVKIIRTTANINFECKFIWEIPINLMKKLMKF